MEHLLALASEVKPAHLWSTGRCTWGGLAPQEAAAFAQLCFKHLLDPEPNERLTQHREPMAILQGTARLMLTLLLPEQRAYGTGEPHIFSTAQISCCVHCRCCFHFCICQSGRHTAQVRSAKLHT